MDSERTSLGHLTLIPSGRYGRVMAHAEQASAHRLSPTSGRCPHRSKRIHADAKVVLRVAIVVLAGLPVAVHAATVVMAADSLAARRPASVHSDSLGMRAPRSGTLAAGGTAPDVRGPLDLD